MRHWRHRLNAFETCSEPGDAGTIGRQNRSIRKGKQMKLDKLSNVAEFVSSVAVLGTLIYLTIEIQQNTQSLQESARQAVVEGDVELLLTATNDPQIWLSRTKTSLTDEERIKLSTYLFAAVRLRERDWNQYRSGVLDEDTWVSYQSGLVGMLSMPQTRKWWDYYSAVGAFPAEFSE
jgi:hypothetical protein